MATTVPILAFNDVYRVHQRYVPQPGAPATSAAPDAEILVSQFAQLVYDLRAQWPPRQQDSARGGSDDDGRDGLFLFAGDVFSPSVESSVTRGSHMVSVAAAPPSSGSESTTSPSLAPALEPSLTAGPRPERAQGRRRLCRQP